MKMHQKFALKLSANLPETGFSLDELVIETKKLFETESMVGFLRVLLILLDHLFAQLKNLGVDIKHQNHQLIVDSTRKVSVEKTGIVMQ